SWFQFPASLKILSTIKIGTLGCVSRRISTNGIVRSEICLGEGLGTQSKTITSAVIFLSIAAISGSILPDPLNPRLKISALSHPPKIEGYAIPGRDAEA